MRRRGGWSILQAFPQQARPTMPRKTCGKQAIKEVQGLEATVLIWQVAAVLGQQVFPQPRGQRKVQGLEATVLIRQVAVLGLQVFPRKT